MPAPRFEDVVVDIADQGGAVVLLERGASQEVVPMVLRLATARGFPLRAPHHSVSPRTLVDELGLAHDGILLLDDVDHLSVPARAQLNAYLDTARVSGGHGPYAIFGTVHAGAGARNTARALADELGLQLLSVDSRGRVTAMGGGRTAPSSEQAQLDLAEINRHRATIFQAPLDPVAAGWGPDDLAAEVRRLRTLNPWTGTKAWLLAW